MSGCGFGEIVRKGLAGGLGFEPRLAESESAVLPLDDSPPAERTRAPRHSLPGEIPQRGSRSAPL